jgi:hypothetical protein
MNLPKALLFLFLISCGKSKTTIDPVAPPPTPLPGRTVHVSTAVQLQAALLDARPGDAIELEDGTYNGKFVVAPNVSGTAANPILLRGSRQAILDAGNINTGYVLYLQSDYWTIKGMTITNGLKGIMADGVHFNIIDSVQVTHIGEEGIHLRRFSSHNTIQNSEITHTGLKTPDYGEGVYIGSAKSNWATYTNGSPDLCDSNYVLNNKIGPGIAAECIDIKEGTTGGLIRGNDFDATGITGANSADSWMDVKGNYYLVENNNGYNPAGSFLKDGYQVNVAYAGWGNYNEFKNNVCTVNAAGYGFYIKLTSSSGTAVGNKVYAGNQVAGAASGLSNIPLTN